MRKTLLYVLAFFGLILSPFAIYGFILGARNPDGVTTKIAGCDVTVPPSR